jgi:hypothetical protein
LTGFVKHYTGRAGYVRVQEGITEGGDVSDTTEPLDFETVCRLAKLTIELRALFLNALKARAEMRDTWAGLSGSAAAAELLSGVKAACNSGFECIDRIQELLMGHVQEFPADQNYSPRQLAEYAMRREQIPGHVYWDLADAIGPRAEMASCSPVVMAAWLLGNIIHDMPVEDRLSALYEADEQLRAFGLRCIGMTV